MFNGIPLSVTATDLEKELWIEGYENGDETEVKRYSVDHDATIVESDGTEVQIAPVDVQFQSAKLWQRMLTNFAGPMNNFILAIITFAILAFMQGGSPVRRPTLQRQRLTQSHDKLAFKRVIRLWP